MKKIKFNNDETEQDKIKNIMEKVMTGIKRIETIDDQIKELKQQVDEQNKFSDVIKYGLEGYKYKIIKTYAENAIVNPQNKINEKIKKDPDIRYPHRKILEFLSQKYDHEKSTFKEANFSTIVNECKIGKNKAGEYLKLLEEKGYIKKRDDGYRVWYKMISLI